MEDNEIVRELIIPELTKISEKLDKLDDKVERLNTSVMGDEQAGVSGIAKRLKETEHYISKQKKTQYIIYGGFSAILFLFKFWDKITTGLKSLTN